ncbi:MAG: hypothetical protein L7F77_00490, partial [Candidatus Magnetominusculus sp. LBB02]|nr:hypothetical protein [Candidatus Magnetominusculus sp. LBB02]
MKPALRMAILLILLMAKAASAQLYLSGYEAVFEAVQNRAGKIADVQTTLRITYSTDSALSSGFK